MVRYYADPLDRLDRRERQQRMVTERYAKSRRSGRMPNRGCETESLWQALLSHLRCTPDIVPDALQRHRTPVRVSWI